MKWSVYNAFGGSAWLAGLFLAKSENLSSPNLYVSPDHHIAVGLAIAAGGLAVLLWTNLRTQA